MFINKVSKIQKLIFAITLCISGLSFLPIIFPKLLLGLVSDYPKIFGEISEVGKLGPFIITINLLLVITLFFLRHKKFNIFSRFIEFLSKYDVSKKKTILLLIVIFAIYVYYSWDELFYEQEKVLSDYFLVLEGIPKLTLFDDNGNLNYNFVRSSLLKISHDILGNIRILPFVSSCILLLFTYLLTKELSKKRLAGLVSVTILLQSNLFLLFDSIATYETFWITFYMISLYLILKKMRLSFIAFIASLLSKAVSFLFLPITLFLITKSEISNRIKFQTVMIYVIPFIIFVFAAEYLGIFDTSEQIKLNYRNFWASVSAFSTGTRFDGLILSTFFPVLLCLYFKSKTYNDYSSFLLFSISILLITPLILNPVLGFTNQPYRLIPIITFFAIAFGSLFSLQSTRSEQL